MDPQFASAQASSGSVVGGLIALAVGLGFVVFMVASMWKVFTKAGQPGWAAIVPIYNFVVLARIAGKSPWLILLALIPYLGAIALYIVLGLGVAKNFGKSTGFGIGLGLLGFVFYPILAWGSSKYTARPAWMDLKVSFTVPSAG